MPDDAAQLLATIKEMANAEMDEVRARAQQEVAGINKRAESQIKQLRDEALARLEDELRTESECIVGRIELEIRDRLIQQKNEAIADVFERAAGQIAELCDTAKYRKIFKRLIQEATGKTDSEDVRLRISNADLPLWKAIKGDFAASISVACCDDPKGTVIVETNDGSQSIDNSVGTRLEMAREVMRRELIEMLFGAEASGEKGE